MNLRAAAKAIIVTEQVLDDPPFDTRPSELKIIFDSLPEAGFFFDVAHARQVDPSMIEAAQILNAFASRVRQVHASGRHVETRRAEVFRPGADVHVRLQSR